MFNKKTAHKLIASLARHPIDGEDYWVVIFDQGKYLAAWIDETGELKKAYRRSAKSAIRLASESWGR